VPVAIKDLVLTKGLRTTFGSRLYADYVPEQDDIVVERLKRAGAIVIGKTNASEFGYGAFGHNPLFPTTRNPWDLSRTPGGSSAGSAAAVAAGVCPIAVGSDGGGSVRLPAAFTGLVGMKASMGRVPVWPGCRDPELPGVSGWESIEHIGPMTRSVADAALMLAVMAGPDMRDRLSLPDDGIDWRARGRPMDRLSLTVAYCPDWQGVAVQPAVRATVERAVAAFEALGCTIETIASPIGDIGPTFGALVALETDIAGLRRLARGREREMMPSIQALLAAPWTAEQFTDAITERKRIVEKLWRLMQRFDLLLTPTARCCRSRSIATGPERSRAGRSATTAGCRRCSRSISAASRRSASPRDGATACRSACRSSAAISPTRRCCGPPASFEQARPWHDKRPPLSP
jgi:aspartyl-tRNA(Asn)/glutamyl-tRNA(Gln) amidotransferase subunit A